jgi:radical SAM protein with 4Fe4S-binding SPASM domain
MGMTRKSQFAEGGIMHATINGHRFHLRLRDPWELNPLWVDGQSPPLLLDKVAAETFALILEGMWKFQQGAGDESDSVREFVADGMYRKYGKQFAIRGRVTKATVRANVDRIFGTVMGVAEGTCPVESELAGKEIRVAEWAAPARMDLALTYRCNLKCRHCYLQDDANGMGELSFPEWRDILAKLWAIGIPQVVFTGGEPTLRDDLVELVGEAEEFVTGLVTNGTRLAELAERLRDASLDYVQVTLEASMPGVHNKMVGAADDFSAFAATVEGIKKALGLGMQVVTNTTLTRENAEMFPDLIRFGRELGLKNMACNTIICSGRGKAAKLTGGVPLDELKGILEKAVATAQEQGINLQWYSPTCYLHLNPLELGFGAKGCSAAAFNMTIQPNGTVLPCQSWPETVGHILKDPWERIWNHPVCKKLRSHGFVQDRPECKKCIHNEVCGGGCPLDAQEGA